MFFGRYCFLRPFYSITYRAKYNNSSCWIDCGGGEVKETISTIPEVIPQPEPKPAPLLPPTPNKPEIKETKVFQQAMKEMVREGDGKPVTGLGCFWIPQLPGAELFFCFDRGDSGIFPYLFHYSYRGRGATNEKLQKVMSMTAKEATFRDGKSSPISPKLKPYLQWISSKWKTASFDPSKYCRVAEKETGGNYLLTCSPDNSHSEPAWSKEVPRGAVEVAKPELMTTA
ncbi:hypothetical protein WEN_03025 [Mycoplasma wenyonii str. Massachusetts]|uniref:Uncharacterized protein n=1 Tax=Mycoplasma wenyonii (strain Massachusetts) TaxID=1197325 RepID=I6Z6Z6_MYCWM|nr:hypothetical protein WEN_03025 [Mycoplasma wenyonii str. Massachusetts]